MFGTPNEEVWPGVMQLKDMKTTYPKWKSRTFEKIVPHMDPIAMDLFKVILYIYWKCYRKLWSMIHSAAFVLRNALRTTISRILAPFLINTKNKGITEILFSLHISI